MLLAPPRVSPQTSAAPALLRSALLATACLGAGCGDANLSPVTGTLGLSVTTTGVDPDRDGYTAVLDSGQVYALPSNGTLLLEDVYAGTYRLTIRDVAANCRAADNPRTITVPSGGTLQVGIAVTCVTSAGAVALWMETTGEDPDTDGYTLTVDGLPALHVPSTGAVTVGPLAAGSHALSLADVSANCAPARPALLIDVPSLAVVQVRYGVACTSLTGRLVIATATGGTDLDADGYTLTLDGAPAATVPSNGTAMVAGVVPGTRIVSLADVAGNCAVAGAPDTVSISAGRSTAASFAVTCTAGPRLRVSTTTSGVDLDRNGYSLTVSDSVVGGARVPITGDLLLGPVQPGVQTVQLGDVAENCQVTDSATRTVTFALGDTAAVRFEVACTPAQLIVFTREDAPGLATVHADGSEFQPLTSGYDHAPAWSPDGTRLAFLRWNCGIGDDFCPGAFTDVVIVSADGAREQLILRGDAGTSPTRLAWTPDGSRIAFSGRYEQTPGLFLMDADGSNVTSILSGIGLGHPSWSPDGSRLVVECMVEPGNADLCIVNSDGSGLRRLTTAADSEYTPAWSPDGSRIVFASTGPSRGLEVVNPDGTGLAPLLPGGLAWPAWSADGQRVAFADLDACFDLDCWWDGIVLSTADGRFLRVLSGAGIEPAWRP